MSSRKAQIFGSAALAGLLVLALAAHRTQAGVNEKPNYTTTTQKDQTDLSITVYNSNLALVRDVRQIHLEPGVFPLRFEDVAASIMPATVHFRSLTGPAKLSVVEQDYEYDLLDPQKLLQKYVGREITLVQRETDSGSTKWVETKALLLSDNSGPVWKIGNELLPEWLPNPIGSPIFPTISTAGPLWSGLSTTAAATRNGSRRPTSRTT